MFFDGFLLKNKYTGLRTNFDHVIVTHKTLNAIKKYKIS